MRRYDVNTEIKKDEDITKDTNKIYYLIIRLSVLKLEDFYAILALSQALAPSGKAFVEFR